MKSLLTFLTVLFLFALLGAALYYGYLSVLYFSGVFLTQEPLIQLVLVLSTVSVLASALFVSGAIKRSAQSRNQSHLIERKFDLYLTILGTYQTILSRIKVDSVGYDEIDNHLSTKDELALNLLAPKSVHDSYKKLKTAVQTKQEKKKIDLSFHNLLQHMRRDLGHYERFKASAYQIFPEAINTESATFTGNVQKPVSGENA